MSTDLKLTVDFGNGTFSGEGDPERVEKLFREFSERVEKLNLRPLAQADDDERELEQADTVEEAVKTRKRKRQPRAMAKVTAGDSAASRMADYSPSRVKDLDLAGLDSFYREWAPKNHPERILLFAYYLQEKLGIAPCAANHIFTCYLAMKERLPKAFVQAFRDASGNDYGYIEFNSLTDISIPIHGRNHVEHGGIQKKTAVRS